MEESPKTLEAEVEAVAVAASPATVAGNPF